MRYFVWTSRPSRGARALAKALKGKVLRPNQTYFPQPDDVVINWGDSKCPLHNIYDAVVLNSAKKVAIAANKRTSLTAFRECHVSIPRFAVTPEGVSWDAMTVVRHKLTGHSGEGIELVRGGGTLPPAPLYVEYIKKAEEYRIHVGKRNEKVGNKTISIQRKARRLDHDHPNWQIRNHDNGFVYVREGVDPPQAVLDEAGRAVVALGLDFGAVDIIWNEQQEKAYVLEVNTAPGLEGTTIEDYAKFFEEA